MPLGNKKRHDFKVGDNIPPNLISHFKQFNTDLVEVEKKTAKKKKIQFYDELKALNKTAQIKLIKKLGGNIIPKYEDGRIKLIQKLQGD